MLPKSAHGLNGEASLMKQWQWQTKNPAVFFYIMSSSRTHKKTRLRNSNDIMFAPISSILQDDPCSLSLYGTYMLRRGWKIRGWNVKPERGKRMEWGIKEKKSGRKESYGASLKEDET